MDAKKKRFEETALPLMPVLYRGAIRLTRNPDDASDLVQETFLRAYRTFGNFVAGTNSKAWMFTILYSIFVNQYRKRQKEPVAIPEEELNEKFAASVESPLSIETPEVERALGELEESFRAVVMLVDIEGFTYEEAAEILKCPVGTVRSRLFRARKSLYVQLKAYAGKLGYKGAGEKDNA